MVDEAIDNALDRLQAAIDRLETDIDIAAAAPPASGGRDDILRAEVQAVIAELDRMIGGQRG